jgi:hypothetical protein
MGAGNPDSGFLVQIQKLTPFRVGSSRVQPAADNAGHTDKPGHFHIIACGPAAAGCGAPSRGAVVVYCRPMGQSPAAPIKNDEIAAMRCCSSLHMNNYAPPCALPDSISSFSTFAIPDWRKQHGGCLKALHEGPQSRGRGVAETNDHVYAPHHFFGPLPGPLPLGERESASGRAQ